MWHFARTSMVGMLVAYFDICLDLSEHECLVRELRESEMVLTFDIWLAVSNVFVGVI